MEVLLPEYLSKEDVIKRGAFYTPERLVRLVISLVEPYISENKTNLIILDSSAGYGAFLKGIAEKGIECRASEIDERFYEYLRKIIEEKNIFITNSLLDVSREKFHIPKNAFLIIVGNPPYNDVTSIYKKGEKGNIIADDDLIDRDIGISFLKSYHKLRADIVCVLHALSFLIKETNFKRLKQFKDNYKLITGVIFPSTIFCYTSRSTPFPIVASLYKKSEGGMDFSYIKKFRFKVLDTDKEFILENFKTTDGYIIKYPPRKNENNISDINLYYHTFRDINSLIRNASFLSKPHHNSIVVNVDTFYKYAYLFAFKHLFRPKNSWIYGNLSPLVNINYLEKNKIYFVKYAILKNQVINNIEQKYINKILDYYGIEELKESEISHLELEIKKHIMSLVKV